MAQAFFIPVGYAPGETGREPPLALTAQDFVTAAVRGFLRSYLHIA